jgi:hypothetical protein
MPHLTAHRDVSASLTGQRTKLAMKWLDLVDLCRGDGQESGKATRAVMGVTQTDRPPSGTAETGLRRMSGAELAYLQDEARQVSGPHDHPEVYLLFLGLFWYPAALCVAILFGLAVVGRTLGIEIAHGAWQDSPAPYRIVMVVLLGCWGWGILWTAQALWQDWTRKDRMQRQLAHDMQARVVCEERVEVCSIKLFREAEHGLFVVFLRLGTGKVLVLYDHDSVDAINYYPATNQPTLRIAERLCIVSYPATGRKRYAFSGTILPWPRQVALAAPMQRWPEEDAYCTTPWDGLEAQFGP